MGRFVTLGFRGSLGTRRSDGLNHPSVVARFRVEAVSGISPRKERIE